MTTLTYTSATLPNQRSLKRWASICPHIAESAGKSSVQFFPVCQPTSTLHALHESQELTALQHRSKREGEGERFPKCTRCTCLAFTHLLLKQQKMVYSTEYFLCTKNHTTTIPSRFEISYRGKQHSVVFSGHAKCRLLYVGRKNLEHYTRLICYTISRKAALCHQPASSAGCVTYKENIHVRSYSFTNNNPRTD